MKYYLFFICLWGFPENLSFQSLSPENFNASVTKKSFFNTSGIDRIYRYRRQKVAIDSKKPMGCKKMHVTENTPFVAIILNKESGRLVCLGSIIDEIHVLTASVCLDNADYSNFKILLGYYKAYWGRHSQVIKVEKAHSHEHGLAILKLQRSISFSKTVKPVKLISEKPPPKDEMKKTEQLVAAYAGTKDFLIIGFPVTNMDVVGGLIPKTLIYKMLEDKQTDKDDDCKGIVPNLGYQLDDKKDPNIVNRIICIEGDSGFRWGSLGSPVLSKDLTQVGVVGYISTAIIGHRIDIFRRWVERHSYVPSAKEES